MELKTCYKTELGDFQTPEGLVKEVVKFLSKEWVWGRILEPTCGTGSFIGGVLNYAPNSEIIGIELQSNYAKIAREKYESHFVKIQNQDIFSVDLKKLDWRNDKPLLVIGNPPWVTNSNIGVVNGDNLPEKKNFKNLSGLDAMTGGANFDISESIIIKIIRELFNQKPTIAMLCKQSVARSVIAFCRAEHIPISNAKIVKIDAVRWFKANVGACLFVMSVGTIKENYEIDVYENLSSDIPSKKITFHKKHIISNEKDYSMLSHLEGKSQFNWRQGIKHDVADIVVLKKDAEGRYVNKMNEIIDVEDEYIYPLVKSSDLNKNEILEIKNWVIIPQKHLFENTDKLKLKAPKLWRYLATHRKEFEERKSAIYKNKPVFTYFGLGDYTFSDYKVAISALYKEPNFKILGKIGNKSVIPDDTCYFVPCNTYEEAKDLANFLNSKQVIKFIKSITFEDSMRVVTKKILQRIKINTSGSRQKALIKSLT